MSASPPGLVPPAPNDPTAVIGSRVVAGLVDGLLFLLMILFVAPGPLSPLAEYAENNDDLSQEEACDLVEQNDDAASGMCLTLGDRVYWTDSSDRPIQAAVELGFVIVYILWQGLTGLTPGKLLLGLRTVNAEGRAPGIGRSFLRTLMWIVDGFPYCLPLVGFITALTSTAHRRVGDMAAGTFVVAKADVGRPVVVPGYNTGAGAGPTPTATAPYGTPTVYPNTPPYQPTGQPSGQPSGGAWGAPPTAPMPTWGAPPAAPPVAPQATPPAPTSPPLAPEAAPVAPAQPEAPTAPMPFGEGADPADFETPAPAPTPSPAPAAEPAPEAESPAEDETGPTQVEAEAGAIAAPQPDTEAAPAGDAEAAAAEAEPSEAPASDEAATETPDEPPAQKEDSPYQPQWDAARGAYIQWDPNRSRWLQWDDTAKEWNPI